MPSRRRWVWVTGTTCAFIALAPHLVVDAAAQVPSREATWRVAERPELTVGRVDGAEEYLLSWIVEAALLSNGGMVLQNSARGLFELRFYDARGQHLATTSRWGQGPYEFEYSRALARLPGDSVLVIGDDWRYAVFGPRGERGREGRIPGSIPAGFEFRYHLIDAAHFGAENGILSERRVSGPERGRRALIVRNFTGASDTVAVLNAERGYIDASGPVNAGYDAPFTPGVFSAASPGVYWFGSTDVPEIYGYRVNGQGMDTIRLNWAPTPVTRADRERWPEEVRAFRLRGAEELGYPDTFPYWGALEVDHAGNLWVLRYEVEWAEGPQRWSVFSPLGEPIANVTIPRAIAPRCTSIGCSTLLDIGVDHVLFIRRGPLDVPQVHLHRLIKN